MLGTRKAGLFHVCHSLLYIFMYVYTYNIYIYLDIDMYGSEAILCSL